MDNKLYDLYVAEDSRLHAVAIIENGNESVIPAVEKELIENDWVIVRYSFISEYQIIFTLNHKDLYKVYENDK